MKDIDTMEALYTLLPSRVGSSFSAYGAADLLRVSHRTIGALFEHMVALELPRAARASRASFPRAPTGPSW
jgi:predicted Kef-type K+ transport protein